ncbi:MAG: MoxR family ATPase [Leptolyngbya sp. SIO1E4]|nr:MoxR family ATPase [Leptolyngbya sp. SIO1E4]
MVKAVDRRFIYTGNVQPEPETFDTKTGRFLYPYFPNPDLVEAVNLAILLERPLLIKGEPGCGKTRLAYAIAYELNLPIYTWYVKSTSIAKDGLYTYDTVGRLKDAQLAASGRLTEQEIKEIDLPDTYLKLGALGEAFKSEERAVVLIDEIDKADIDFPNDLLLELDEKRFFIQEIKTEIKAKEPPIVIVTSNDEKELSDAFLRRCLFQYLEFPAKETLAKIIKNLFKDLSDPILDKATERFLKLRASMENREGLGKKISTSELIDWVNVMQYYPEDEILLKLDGKIPFASILLKKWDHHIYYLSQEFSGTNATQ